jgi:hypothetical protein
MIEWSAEKMMSFSSTCLNRRTPSLGKTSLHTNVNDSNIVHEYVFAPRIRFNHVERGT